MRDDQGKILKKEFVERFDKAKGRLQQSVPEIQHLVKTSNIVEAARKIIDPAQSIFKQFADDIQLKDLFAKAEALVANLTVAKSVSPPPETSPNETPANKLPLKKASLKKAPSKRVRSKKPLKKTPLKGGRLNEE